MAKRPLIEDAKGGPIRCAVYTRKSTEEGLDQDFNSLDAQYEACTAYIASQRHEGWTLTPERYDDGGFSGGNIERPGLQRLLADVAAKKVQVIVIYKIDRLTRSLADFAKIVEILDKAGASFVSVTQSFNTTTSMGRLTLNMLLSFAQFEREVTAERIRDKFAASRAKGMWMGGSVPLGYRVQDRKLIVDEAEAETVRHIFQRYLILGSGPALIAELRERGIGTKVQQLSDGRIRGGGPFTPGGLSYLLKNRTYIGEVTHKGTAYPGEQPGIIDMELWEGVQNLLSINSIASPLKRGPRTRSLLAGFIVDGLDRRMTPSHATKGGRRYHYYVTHSSALDSGDPAWRIGARDIEQAVITMTQRVFEDGAIIERLIGTVTNDVQAVAKALDLARTATHRLSSKDDCRIWIPRLVNQVQLLQNEVRISVRAEGLLQMIELSAGTHVGEILTRSVSIARVRIGKQVKLMLGDGLHLRDDSLVTLIAQAHAARDAVLKRPDRTIKQVAEETGQCRHRLARLVNLSWLSPSLVDAIIAGKQPAGLTARQLLTVDLPLGWADQKALLGFA